MTENCFQVFNNFLQVSQSITDGLKALRGAGDSKEQDRDEGRSSNKDRERDRASDSRVRGPESEDNCGKRIILVQNLVH